MSKSRVTKTAQQITANWANGLKQNISKIQAGVNAVTESPMEKAASQQDKMLRGITAAVSSGRWAAGLRSVSLADWKTKTTTKIASSLSTGVDNAVQKHQRFAGYLVETLNAILPELANMPNNTIEDGINKVATLVRHMANNKYKQ
jgi:hypothetical protein